MNCRFDEVPDNATLCPIVYTNKSLSSIKQHYSNIECKTLGILHGLEKSHCYCFAKEVCIITDHKLLVVILSKYMAMFQQVQCIML